MLSVVLDRFIKTGRLTVIKPNGRHISFGELPSDRPHLDVVVRLKNTQTLFKLALNPELCLGEAFMNEDLIIEKGSLWDLLEILGRNLERYRQQKSGAFHRMARRIFRRLQQYNPPRRSQRNAAHHYNISGALYREFLDEDLQYSCAYFPEPGLSIGQAQAAKKRHIAAKLLLQRGHRVLDIGSGWGGLALYLSELTGARVTGITLSEEQLDVARNRGRISAQHDNVRFDLRDYRSVEGQFERIVSVGMFEHVGVPYYEEFFSRVRDYLTDDGVALIHSIGRMSPPGTTNPWIRKYIFPGGYTPALSEVMAAVEKTGLWITDVEIWRLHYAETLRHWRQRFLRSKPAILELYDERFCRMWEFYLAASEMSFRFDDMMVFQLQLSKKLETVPLTRDYMVDRERKIGCEASESLSSKGV